MTNDSNDGIDRTAPTIRPVGVRRVMRQLWRELLFLHWPLAPDAIQSLLPPGLTVDTFGGNAYVGLVPFTMKGVRPLWSPPVPGLSNFHEINVRTYAHRDGRDPGVWFFSLDASNPIAVTLARLLFHLPYFNAAITLRESEDERIDYRATRRGGWGGQPGVACAVRYEATGPVTPALPGTLEHFLVERYLLYSADRHGGLHRGQIHHTPYPLQSATVVMTANDLVRAVGIALPNGDDLHAPLIHYARGVDVDIYPLRRLG